jgi:hypothetical protein
MLGASYAGLPEEYRSDFEVYEGVSNVLGSVGISNEIFFLGLFPTVRSCMHACKSFDRYGKACVSFTWTSHDKTANGKAPCFARTDDVWAPNAQDNSFSGKLSAVGERSKDSMHADSDVGAQKQKREATLDSQSIVCDGTSEDVHASSCHKQNAPSRSRDSDHGSNDYFGGQNQAAGPQLSPNAMENNERNQTTAGSMAACMVLEWRLMGTFELGTAVKTIMSGRSCVMTTRSNAVSHLVCMHAHMHSHGKMTPCRDAQSKGFLVCVRVHGNRWILSAR